MFNELFGNATALDLLRKKDGTLAEVLFFRADPCLKVTERTASCNNNSYLDFLVEAARAHACKDSGVITAAGTAG